MNGFPERREFKTERGGHLIDGNNKLKPEEFIDYETQEASQTDSVGTDGRKFLKPDLKLVTNDFEATDGIEVSEVDMPAYEAAVNEFEAKLAKEINILDVEETRRALNNQNNFSNLPSMRNENVTENTRELYEEISPFSENKNESILIKERLAELESSFIRTENSQERAELSLEIRKNRNILEEDVKKKIEIERNNLNKLLETASEESPEIVQVLRKIEAYRKIYEDIHNPQEKFQVAIEKLKERLGEYQVEYQSMSLSVPERIKLAAKIEETNGQLRAYKNLLSQSQNFQQENISPSISVPKKTIPNSTLPDQKGTKAFVKKMWNGLKSWFS